MAPLNEHERAEINRIVARFESDTGIQAVAAVTANADDYPEIPWKAFALGAALAALVAALHPTVIRVWSDTSVAALDAMLILASGALVAAIAAFVPPFGKLFLDRLRARGESLQYAKELFLERELFRTRARCAVLVVMCHFEGLAVVVADCGLAQYAPAADLTAIGDNAGALLKRGEVVRAFDLAFDGIKSLLALHGMKSQPAAENELDDAVLIGRGA